MRFALILVLLLVATLAFALMTEPGPVEEACGGFRQDGLCIF